MNKNTDIFENAIEIFKTFSLGCEVNTSVFKNDGTILNDYKTCELCKYAIDLDSKKCLDTHIYGCQQARRFGNRAYVFFCHMGLVNIVLPISKNDELIGGVMSGPFLMMEPEDFMLEDFILDKKIIENKKKYINNIPIITPKRMEALSQLMNMIFEKSSKEDDSTEINSKISEYIHHLKSFGGSYEESYPFEKEKELITKIKLVDKEGAQKILNEIFGHIMYKSGMKYDIVKARVLELIVVLSRAAIEGGADVNQIFGMNYHYINKINDFEKIEDLTTWLSVVLKRFIEEVFDMQDVKHVDAIYKSIEYIKRNYMKKVTLDELAKNSYLSSSYFSRIFKKEMNCTFNYYLNYVRIELSKKLLVDKSISLVDVSALVGFEDQSYYSKVFKKITGVSPGKFREKRGVV